MMFDTRLVYVVGEEQYCVSAADFDFCGDIDLVVANHVSEDVSVLLNDRRGILREAGTYRTDREPCFIVMCDLCGNGELDGDCDLAVTNTMANTISIMINTTTD